MLILEYISYDILQAVQIDFFKLHKAFVDTFIFLHLSCNKSNLLKLCVLCVWLFKSTVAWGGLEKWLGG